MFSKLPRWTSNLLALLLVAAGVLVVMYMVKTKPTPGKNDTVALAPLVQTIGVSSTDIQAEISAQGVVRPSRELNVIAEVGGKIVSLNEQLVPGSQIVKGTKLLRIDPREYQLSVSQSLATVEKRKLALVQEEAKREVSAWEWKTYNERGKKTTKRGGESTDATTVLALRKPHLKSAQADVRSAQSSLAQARLKLNRTQIKAPFNVMVLSESVELGQVVNAGSTLLKLVGTDSFRIQASIPVTTLRHLSLPRDGKKGSKVEIRVPEQPPRTGHLIQILGELDSSGRMARILVEVEDPLELKSQNGSLGLLLGSYVDLSIDGPLLKSVAEVPRATVDAKSRVWLVSSTNQLEQRTVEILWRGKNTFIVDGLKEGEKLMISTLTAPQVGMAVRRVGGES